MFTEEINKIKSVSAETRNAITRKSAQTLPNNPSAQGYSAEEIKRRFYQPILDAANSTLSEIDRVVDEVNAAIGQLDTNMDTFLEKSFVSNPYKVQLDEKTWKLNDDTGLYEFIVTKEEHGIENHEEIGVDMFLLDGNGKYTAVNQFEVLQDSTVRCFNENNGAGYLSIYTKREGYVWGDNVIDVNHVIGISKVGVSNSYNDLDDRPDLEIMYANEQMLAKIIAGTQVVYRAINAENAEKATYASTSGTADNATIAQSAVKASEDQFGVNISTGYCKQNGNYPNLKSGKSTLADTAKADEDGLNIKTNYAQKTGTYPTMTVGNATNATNAKNADLANKASQDGNGANIVSTYATKTGNYPNMSVGQAKSLSGGGNIPADTKAVTKPVGDNSESVATTAFVQAAIANKLNIAEGNIMFGGSVAGKVYRQVDVVYGYISYGVDIKNGQNGTLSFSMPKDFAPKSSICILDGTLYLDDNDDDRAYLRDFTITQNGMIDTHARNSMWVHATINVNLKFGYHI